MGTGFYGGFGNTHGASQSNAPVKSPKDVRYSKKKTEGYLLNINHPVGGFQSHIYEKCFRLFAKRFEVIS